MGRKAKFDELGLIKQTKGPGRKAKKQKPPKVLPGLPKLEGKYVIKLHLNSFKLIRLLFQGDDEPKKLSHRQKQRASRRTKKKEERKLIKKEKKKGSRKEENEESEFFFAVYQLY